MDITSKGSSPEPAWETDHKFQLITDVLPHMIWEIEAGGRVSFINKQWSDWTGLTLKEINSGGWSKIFHPEDFIKVSETWRKAFTNKNEFYGEYRIKDRNEKYFWFLFKTVPLTNSNGDIIKWIGTSTNVDEQKKSEEALKESETRFRQLADVMPQQVWTANDKGELDYVNLITINYFGKTEQEIIGDGWQAVIHPDDLESVLTTWERSLTRTEPYQVEFRLRNKEGIYRWHLGRASCFENKNQLKWFGTNTDIEAHKYNELKKDEFISMASHELKTPVTSLKGYAHVLQIQFEREGNTKAVDLVKRMDVQLNKLTRLIGDFLNVSKIEARQLQLDKQEFSFNELVEECISGAQITSPGHKIIIECDEQMSFYGDRLRLEQVFDNFLSNAVKYSPGAEKIIVRFQKQLNNIVVSIQDFGIGIAKENLDKIFNRFYRIDNTSAKFQGLGLGLYISSEIIKAHKGSFWIESDFGKGATFYFLLPLNDSDERQDISTDNKTYYSENKLTIRYNEEHDWLEADWKGFQNFDSVQRGCLVMLDLLKKNNCSKVLNDNRSVLGNWSEAADWGGKVWFPAMQKAGLKFFAWIYSPSTFSKLSAHKSLDVLVGNITTQFFSAPEEAKHWLKTMG